MRHQHSKSYRLVYMQFKALIYFYSPLHASSTVQKHILQMAGLLLHIRYGFLFLWPVGGISGQVGQRLKSGSERQWLSFLQIAIIVSDRYFDKASSNGSEIHSKFRLTS
jgi:hypothetical protein